MAENEDTGPGRVSAKINFVFRTQSPSLAAHHMLVQEDESDVLLSFFEILLPIFPSDPSEKVKVIEEVETGGINAECVARIRIAKHRYGNFVRALVETNNRIENELASLADKYADHKPNKS